MALYTMELRDALEYLESMGASTGLEEYPIFDETYRPLLNKKIRDHYYLREIGLETAEQFAFYLGRKMNEIMPLFNKLYIADAKDLDPLVNFRTSSTSTSEGSSESAASEKSISKQDSSTESDGEATQYAMPQQQLSDRENYATGAGVNKSSTDTSGSGENESEGSQKAESKGHIVASSEGFTGVSLASMMNEFLTLAVNIDMQVIQELEPLFMQVWDNSDAITERNLPYLPYPWAFRGPWY